MSDATENSNQENLGEAVGGNIPSRQGKSVASTATAKPFNFKDMERGAIILARKTIDERVSSRIAGMCKVLKFSGKDRRLSK